MASLSDIEKAVSLHGHLCPALVVGIRLCDAVKQALADTEPPQPVEIVVGTITPLVDAVQALLGATLGNGRLALAPDVGVDTVLGTRANATLEIKFTAPASQALRECPALAPSPGSVMSAPLLLHCDEHDVFAIAVASGWQRPWAVLDLRTRDDALVMRPIGVVCSPLRAGYAPPRARADEAILMLRPELAGALLGLESCSHLQILFRFSHASSRAPLQQHPQGDRTKPVRGVWALRSPHRPNGIGLTTVRLLRVEGTRILVAGLDAWDGSPVLDIKPYVPGVDAQSPRCRA